MCSDEDSPPCIAFLNRVLDAMVSQLKARDLSSEPERLDVAKRLEWTDFREDVMAAIYPGNSRARYHPHIDNDRGHIHRVLTAIVYLNEDWVPSHGGVLRLFNEGSLPLPQPTDLGAKYDV